MTTKTKSIMLLIVTALLWSLGGLLVKSIQWNSMAIAGMRSAIAIPIILLVVKKSYFTFSRPQLAAACFYSATVTLFVIANGLTTAANSVLLQYTAPIYVAVFGIILLKEPVHARDWVIIAAALTGICLFFIDKLEPGNLLGNILALLSGISFALMIVFLRMQKHGFPVGSIFIGNILTALLMAPFMLREVPRDQVSWTALIFLGACQLGIPYVLYTKAIKNVTALEGVLIPLLEPILNPVWVMLFIGERPGKWALLGGIVVLGSLIARAWYMYHDLQRTPAVSCD